MLSINNLSFSFGSRYLFENVTFTIQSGDRIGLVGKNGAGKTTLFKILNAGYKPETGEIIKSSDYRIGYLPQELDFFSNSSVIEEAMKAFAELLEIQSEIDDIAHNLTQRSDYESKGYEDLTHKLSDKTELFNARGGATMQASAEQILTGLGFSRVDFFRPMSEFSGGWQMRVELAKILLRQPDLVMLDEPTNHLDIESIQWLESFLRNYRGAVLLISHDRTFLDNITNRTVEIVGSKIYSYDANYSNFIDIRAERMRSQLASYQNQQKYIEKTQKWIDRFKYKATLASRAQSKMKLLEKLEKVELDEFDDSALDFTFPEAPRAGAVVVETKNLNKSYGANHVLKNLNFELGRGERIAFVGRNGEGKTTFSKIIAGAEPYEGVMKYGANVAIGYYSQSSAAEMPPEMTAYDFIEREAGAEMRPRVRSILGAFLFSGDDVYKKAKVLSGGEKSRLALARLLLRPSNLLILDEPTNHLDMKSKDILKSALLEYEGALIIVSHDRDFLTDLVDKTADFKDGKIKIYDGGIDYFLEKKKIDSLAELTIKKAENNAGENKEQKSKMDREAQKAYDREKRRLEREIENIENEIAKTEQEIAQIEAEMAKADFYAHAEKAKNIVDKYDELRAKINTLMQAWEKSSEELENL